MTGVPSDGGRTRRGGRRPGWTLFTALLVLAILASSALVFTSRVELLRLAVLMALWAAVVAAFVSVIYRRQSDAERSRVRDLKFVYDLQLDREISARREYELTVESKLRSELASELRTQAADEVAALRGELAALRNNLEILFDTDLGDRPALERERTTVHAYSDWDRSDDGGRTDNGHGPSSRSHVRSEVVTGRTGENPIIDVPEVGVPTPAEPAAASWQRPVTEHHVGYAGGRHSAAPGPAADHRPGRWPRPEPEHAAGRWTSQPQAYPAPGPAPRPRPVVEPQAAAPTEQPQPAAPTEQPRPEPTARAAAPGSTGWQPIAAEGRWLPPGAPGSNWVSDAPPTDLGAAFAEPAPRPRRGRHTAEPAAHAAEPSDGGGPPGDDDRAGQQRRARHSADSADQGQQTAGTAPRSGLTTPAAPGFTSAPPGYTTAPGTGPQPAARHRSTEPDEASASDPPTGGQSVADLVARLQPTGTGGRRRRRREE